MKKYVVQIVNTNLLESEDKLIYERFKKLTLESFQNEEILIGSINFKCNYRKGLFYFFYKQFLNFDYSKHEDGSWVEVVLYQEYNNSLASFISRVFFSKTTYTPLILAKSNLKKFESHLTEIIN